MSVRRLRDGRYAVEFQQAGERVFRRCPRGVGKAEAEQYEAQLRRALFRQQALGEKPVVPLAAAIQLWLEETTTHKRDQRKPRENALLLAELVGDKALTDAPDVAQAAVQAWGDTLTAGTINRRLAVLKAACKHAWRRGLIDANLSGRIPLLPEGPGRAVFLTPAEILRLARAAPNATCRAAIMLLAYSGLRVSELLALDAMPRNAKGFVVANSKTGRPRLVPVVALIRPYLRELPLGVSYRTLVGWFWQARDKAKLSHVRIHDLRHTTASLLANKGVPLHVIAEILGDHPLTARRYAHLLQSTLRTAMCKIG